MDALFTFWQNSGTKLLGVMGGTLGIIAGAGVIPPDQLKYWMLAIGIITFWRGTGNTQAIASAVVQQHADAIATSVATGSPPILAPAGNLQGNMK